MRCAGCRFADRLFLGCDWGHRVCWVIAWLGTVSLHRGSSGAAWEGEAVLRQRSGALGWVPLAMPCFSSATLGGKICRFPWLT